MAGAQGKKNVRIGCYPLEGYCQLVGWRVKGHFLCEADATKRALATCGNRFGPAICGPEQKRVCRRNGNGHGIAGGLLGAATGDLLSRHGIPEEFCGALRDLMQRTAALDRLKAIPGAERPRRHPSPVSLASPRDCEGGTHCSVKDTESRRGCFAKRGNPGTMVRRPTRMRARPVFRRRISRDDELAKLTRDETSSERSLQRALRSLERRQAMRRGVGIFAPVVFPQVASFW